MQKIYSHENLAIVASAKNLLELNGIDCFIKNEYHAAGGHVGLEVVPIELWVQDSAEASSAIAILEEELSAPSSEPEWTCAYCGESNGGAFETCWKCHKAPASS